ncbi:uncharacterized protein CMU_036570 [Cryptosporidium muris RN66]|uniref:Transmembrane protein n=1 Tax=Cryptosporidium muris (strain RN66) TaxID=441375 RepID=B6AGZ2_CRYMR|nr:uncharacterized protein CMU_036570 [Cryptosporidium muris RN66]EEA07483.1 hypothetical protein CMU_036570 [Cryptosporidium muris RN66]|eukprot:XP_002141832.1 hypothetical protein [Cryptosporidium muris RN66]
MISPFLSFPNILLASSNQTQAAMSTTEVNKWLYILKGVSIFHIIFGSIGLLTPNIVWAIFQISTLGCFGLYISIRKSPIKYYLMYYLISVFQIIVCILLVIRNLNFLQDIMKNSDNSKVIEPYIGDKPEMVQLTIWSLRLSIFSSAISLVFCTASSYFIWQIINYVLNHSQYDILNRVEDNQNEYLNFYNMNNSNILSTNNNMLTPNTDTFQVFSGVGRTLKDSMAK